MNCSRSHLCSTLLRLTIARGHTRAAREAVDRALAVVRNRDASGTARAKDVGHDPR